MRPIAFGFNFETSQSNPFQNKPEGKPEGVNQSAIKEFDNAVRVLRERGVVVDVFQDNITPITPDSIFPNNWLVTGVNGLLSLFPMESRNRRQELSTEVISSLHNKYGVKEVLNYSKHAEEGVFLEGTGSLVFDHDNKTAYASISSRTNADLAKKYCEEIGFQLQSFKAYDSKQMPIYHTNLLMAIGKRQVIICKEVIQSQDWDGLERSFRVNGKEVLVFSEAQMNSFCGNMLELCDQNDKPFWVCSQSAWDSFSFKQRHQLNNPLIIPIPTIENIGGGGIRCMIAENYLV